MKKAIWIYLVLFVVANFLFIGKYPGAWIDTGFYSESAWSFVQNQVYTMPSGAMVYDWEDAIIGRLGLAPKVLIFALTGGVSLFKCIIPSFLFGILALVLFYRLALEISNETVAFISTVFLSLSQKFLFCLHDARPESMVLFMVFLVIWLYIKRSWLLLGFCSLVVDIHLAGIVCFFIVLVLIVRNRKTLDNRVFWVIPGIIVGSFWWVGCHYLCNPVVFKAQWTLFWSASTVVYSPTTIIEDLQMYYSFFWEGRLHRNMFLLVVWVGSIIYAIKNHSKCREFCLLMILAYYLFSLLAVKKPYTTYMIYLIPFCILLTVDVLQKYRKLLFIVLVFYLCEAGYIFYVFKDSSYSKYINRLCEHIPKDSISCGDPTYWAGMISKGRKYYCKVAQYRCGISLEKMVDNKNIDYIIYDNSFVWGADVAAFDYLKTCKKIAGFTDNFYGYNLWRKGEYKTFIYETKRGE